MCKTAVTVDLSGRAHIGIVIMRPREGEERATLLLNVAETQARIRHLHGFLSASFLSDRDGRVLVEFLQWRSAEHVEAAFREPAFHEHLPVVTAMAPNPVIAFGAPAAVLTSRGKPCFTLDHERYAATVLRVEGPGLDGALRGVVGWARSLVGGEVDAAVIAADRKGLLIAVLLAGSFSALPPPDLSALGIAVVEHLGALDLYDSIVTAGTEEEALRYTMTVI